MGIDLAEALEVAKKDGYSLPETPRYVIRDGKFALSDLPELQYLVESKITTQSVGMFYGDPGTKKTYSLIHLAVCVALGKHWLGFEVRPCKVLIIDEESGELRLGRRLGMTIRGEYGDELIPLEFVSMTSFKLDRKEDLQEIQGLIRETGAGLVIVDALADVMDGDENSKKDTQPVFNNLRRLSELTGATFIIIHHSNKAGGYRGSSAIKGALDFMFKVESEDGSEFITFKNEKSRDGKSGNFKAKAHWADDRFFLTEVENLPEIKKETAGEKFVIRFLTENGPSQLPDIMGAVDSCSSESARKGVYSLVDKGNVHRINSEERGKGVKAVYDLVRE